jgi:hypothetical protein
MLAKVKIACWGVGMRRLIGSDVNKDSTVKAKAKAWTFKAQA